MNESVSSLEKIQGVDDANEGWVELTVVVVVVVVVGSCRREISFPAIERAKAEAVTTGTNTGTWEESNQTTLIGRDGGRCFIGPFLSHKLWII